jgi:hypothetical protein
LLAKDDGSYLCVSSYVLSLYFILVTNWV